MLTLRDTETMVEYYRTTPEGRKNTIKIRFDELGFYQVEQQDCSWVSVEISHNELLCSTFEPCEWVPKIGEQYFTPNPSRLYFFDSDEPCLCEKFIFNNDDIDYRIKKNIGWYKTPKEAHAKSLEMGWTL